LNSNTSEVCGTLAIIIVGLVMLSMMTGCVGIQTYADDVQKAENKGYVQGFNDCWERFVMKRYIEKSKELKQ
jgi:hypothetical protein